MKTIYILCFLVLGLSFSSCTEEKKEQKTVPEWSKDQSAALNKVLNNEEEIRIRLFLNQKQDWDFKKTGTGLRYWIYEAHEGPKAKAYDNVSVRFEIKLLDGTLLYQTEEGELSTFKIDKTDVESGIMEGLKYLSEGEKAKFIIPSHIGHGLLGDFNKIPPLEVLLVDVELVKIN